MDSKTDWIFVVLSFLMLIGVLAFALAKPYYEAKAFNECTGGHASYSTALFTQLRVEDCK